MPTSESIERRPTKVRLTRIGSTAGSRRGTIVGAAAVLVAIGATAIVPATAAHGATLTDTAVIDVVVVDDHIDTHSTSSPTAGEPLGSADSSLRTQTYAVTDNGTYPVPAAVAAAGSWRTGDQVNLTLAATAPVSAQSAAEVTPASARVVDVRDRSPERTRARRAMATASAAGAHQLIVLPVHWSTPDDQTTTTLGHLGTKSANYWSAQSGGSIQLAVSVRDWANIPAPQGCDPSAVFDAALAANGLSEPTDARIHLAIYTPRWAECTWAGLGTVGGSRIWMNGFALPDILSHELGHNLGLGHANLATCTDAGRRVPLSESCTGTEYGDGADVMGYATYQESGNLNTALADQLGLVQTVDPAPGEGASVDLAPLARTDQVRALKMRLPDGWVYVDYRPAVFPDTRRTDWSGVQVHFLPDGPYPQSYLLDMQPWQPEPFATVKVQDYAVWRVPSSDAAVSMRLAADGVTPQLRLVRTGSDTEPPTAPVASTSATENAPTRVLWSPAEDTGSGVAGYRLLSQGLPIGFASPESTSADLPAEVSEVQVEALDAAGNSARSAVLRLDGTDTSKPAPPTLISPAARVVQSSNTVQLTWNPGEDPESGISGYRIEVNGQLQELPSSARSATVVVPTNCLSIVNLTAVNGAGLVSDAVTVTVVHDNIAPTTPTRLARTPGTAVVTWAPSHDASAVRYLVSVDGGEWVSTDQTTSPLGVQTGWHTWFVRAVDEAGNVSGIARITALVDTSPSSTPKARQRGPVQNGANGTRSALISWTAASDRQSGISGYRIEVTTAAGGTVRTTSAAIRQVRVSIPQNGATIRVRAINGGGTASAASSVSVAYAKIPTRSFGVSVGPNH